MAIVVDRVRNPDGTLTLWYDDNTSKTVGTPRDPVALATQQSQEAIARTKALYGDPWYQEHFLDPMSEKVANEAKERALILKRQGDQLKMQGRTAEANMAYQKAQVELRKMELRQSGYLQERGQNIQIAGMLANARGAGNAAQRIDLGRRLGGFGMQSSALAQIAAGGVPQGAFSMASGARPTSEADYLSGLLGAGQVQIDQRDANDRMLARQIGANVTRLARGSIESLSPYEQSYLGSYLDAEGFDQGQFQDEYKRAGIMQGRR